MCENLAVLFKKMSNVMGHLDRIPKNGKHDKQGWNYATAEDVKQAVRQAMSREGLALLVNLPTYTSEVIGKTGSGSSIIKASGVVEFTIACGETGATITRSIPGEALDYGGDKAIFKMLTSVTKYFLINTFVISTGDEPDNDQTDIPDERNVGKRETQTNGHSKKSPQQQPAKANSKPNDNEQADKAKPYRWPSTAAKNFYEAVQTATSDGYTSPYHLVQTIGGWFNFADEDLYNEKMSIAVDHIRMKVGDTGSGLFGDEPQPQSAGAFDVTD